MEEVYTDQTYFPPNPRSCRFPAIGPFLDSLFKQNKGSQKRLGKLSCLLYIPGYFGVWVEGVALK